MSPRDDEAGYRIVIKDRAKIVKEHLATLRADGSGFVFGSTTKPDYRFVPEPDGVSARVFGVGAYRAFVQDRPVVCSGALVQVRAAGEGFVVGMPNLISIEITKIETPEPPVVSSWQSPFHDQPRSRYSTLASRVVSSYGAGRSSFQVSHLHTGVDLAGVPSEPVRPIGVGVVEFVSYWDHTGTVVVRHRQKSGAPVFSRYTHVRDPGVHAGDLVTGDTILARLFTTAEFRKSGYRHNHVHLELRKDYSDHGHASTYSDSADELSRCCIDPLTVLPH